MTPRQIAPFERQREVLDNGLRVVTLELPHLHTVSIVMYAKVGSRYESQADNGLSHFLEHMLFRGTARLPDAYQLNRAIEAIGGTLYAETGRDYSLYQISLHPDSLAEGIALFGDIFSTPTFTDVDVERRIVLQEMLEDLDEAGKLVNVDDITRQLVWPDHPLGYRITGPYENVERFNDADVRRHFSKFYGATNMVLCVSGAIDSAKVMTAVRQAMAPIPRGQPAELVSPTVVQTAAKFAYVKNEGSQTAVQLLFRGIPETDADYPSLLMLARIIDDGMSTRLHRRLCDELGLAYYVSGSIEPFFDTGLYEIDAAAHPDQVLPLVTESLQLLSQLSAELPSQAELEKAKRRYVWDLERSFDDPDAMAGWWAGTELFSGPSTISEKLDRVQKVTCESVQAMAARLFRPECLVVGCVGSLSKARRQEIERLVCSWKQA